MIREKFLVSGSSCMWRYLSILSLRQWTIRFMMSLFIPEQSRAVAPVERIERVETSLGFKSQVWLE